MLDKYSKEDLELVIKILDENLFVFTKDMPHPARGKFDATPGNAVAHIIGVLETHIYGPEPECVSTHMDIC